MTGSGSDMVRAPLMAVNVPTNLPSPEMGNMSPYLENIKMNFCIFDIETHPTVVMVIMTQ